MKFVSNIAFALTVLFLATACGKGRLEERTATVSGSQSAFDAETAYRNLPAPDYTVTYNPMMFGGSTEQRQTAARFCRRSSAISPNSVYHYTCWEHASTGATAQSLYASLAAFREYGISLGMFGGGIQEAIAADESLICQKVTPAVLNPTSTYDCFKKL